MKSLQKLFPLLTSIMVAVAGFVSLAQVLSVHVRHRQFGHIDDSLLPFNVAQNSRLLILGTGILLLYLSLQIYRRKRIAWQLVSVGLVLLIFAEVLNFKNIVQLIFYSVILALLFETRKQYTVEANNVSLRRGVSTALTIIAIVFLYATVGFTQLSNREVGVKPSLVSATKYAAREIFTFQESEIPLRSRHAKWFVVSVNTASAVAYILAVVSLFRPLQFRYGASRHDQELARRILATHSNNTEDYFKLWPPDKHYFFSPEQDSFVAYKVVGGDALVLGGPSGNPDHFGDLINDFAAFSKRNSWTVAYINTSDAFDSIPGADVYRRLFIGNEAVIDLTTFAETTSHSKHFRYIRNRAERDELTFEYWPAPLSADQVDRLRHISDEWLRKGSRREYTFALGYFDTGYIRSCDAAVLTHHGKAVAYANVLPVMTPTIQSIDHMRYTKNMPSTGMHYLLMQLILHLQTAGVREFNLGLSPLSGIEARDESTIPERLLTALKKLGSAYYSFSGLEQFKNKFEPAWQPRYIYYQGSTARLLRLARSLGKAVNIPVAGQARRTAVLAMSVVAALCYASFPLAYLLSPHHTFTGLASELGSSTQAYAGLFNGLDVASSVLIFIIIGLLWVKLRPDSQLPRIILMLFGLGALGTLLSALAPLPADTASTLNGLHDFFTAISIIGTCSSAAALILFVGPSRWLTSLLILLLAALITSGIYENQVLGDIAQRVLIILTGLWMIVISWRLSRPNLEPYSYRVTPKS